MLKVKIIKFYKSFLFISFFSLFNSVVSTPVDSSISQIEASQEIIEEKDLKSDSKTLDSKKHKTIILKVIQAIIPAYFCALFIIPDFYRAVRHSVMLYKISKKIKKLDALLKLFPEELKNRVVIDEIDQAIGYKIIDSNFFFKIMEANTYLLTQTIYGKSAKIIEPPCLAKFISIYDEHKNNPYELTLSILGVLMEEAKEIDKSNNTNKHSVELSTALLLLTKQAHFKKSFFETATSFVKKNLGVKKESKKNRKILDELTAPF